MFKVGDKVFVASKTRGYSVTDFGSYGTVSRLVNGHPDLISVDFHHATGKHSQAMARLKNYDVFIEDLSPLTKLHKILHGIENAD